MTNQPGRVCGGCTLCCKLVPVASLKKKAGERCRNQRHGKGCAIYETRPVDCFSWSCEWLTNPLTERLRRPDRSHYVIDVMLDVIRMGRPDGTNLEVEVMQVWVDPAYPEAYRDPDLYAFIDYVAQKWGRATLLRWSNLRGRAIFAPCFDPEGGEWHESETGTPNPNFGRYAALPDHERPPFP